jgi:protein-tyrosine phosphatase
MSLMQDQAISRVVCLLSNSQLQLYDSPKGSLIDCYKRLFGDKNVLHEPVSDFCLIGQDGLFRVLSFLREAVQTGEMSIVHCEGGIGRTGHVLACWLAYRYGLGPFESINAVLPPREPREAAKHKPELEEELIALLRMSREAGIQNIEP